MNSFPKLLSVTNKHNFAEINNERILNLFREHIYLHMLKNYHTERDENNYIDLDVFCKQHLTNKNEKIIKDIVSIVIKELEAFATCKAIVSRILILLILTFEQFISPLISNS